MNNVIVVTSGKGGVGKSTLTTIIGKSLSSYYKVLLIDGDIGLKNLENCLSLDLNNKDITDVLMGRCSLEEAITHVEKNLDLMSLCQRDNVKNFDTNLLSTLIDMVEKDYMLYGTKILNLKTQEIGLLICLWENKFVDKTVDFATCIDKTGKRYNIELDNIRGFEDDFEK